MHLLCTVDYNKLMHTININEPTLFMAIIVSRMHHTYPLISSKSDGGWIEATIEIIYG